MTTPLPHSRIVALRSHRMTPLPGGEPIWSAAAGSLAKTRRFSETLSWRFGIRPIDRRKFTSPDSQDPLPRTTATSLSRVRQQDPSEAPPRRSLRNAGSFGVNLRLFPPSQARGSEKWGANPPIVKRPHASLQSSDDPAPVLRTASRAHPAQLDEAKRQSLPSLGNLTRL